MVRPRENRQDGGMAGLDAAARNDPAPALPAALHGGRARQSARRPRDVSGRDGSIAFTAPTSPKRSAKTFRRAASASPATASSSISLFARRYRRQSDHPSSRLSLGAPSMSRTRDAPHPPTFGIRAAGAFGDRRRRVDARRRQTARRTRLRRQRGPAGIFGSRCGGKMERIRRRFLPRRRRRDLRRPEQGDFMFPLNAAERFRGAACRQDRSAVAQFELDVRSRGLAEPAVRRDHLPRRPGLHGAAQAEDRISAGAR